MTYRDDVNGYVADVQYSGEARYPEYKPAASYQQPKYSPAPAYPAPAKPAYPAPSKY